MHSNRTGVKKSIRRRCATTAVTSMFLMQALLPALAQPLSGQPDKPGAGNSSHLIAQAPASSISPPMKSEIPLPSTNYETVTLREAIKGGKASITVTGDGENTNQMQVFMKNLSDKPLRVVIPENEIIRPTPTAFKILSALLLGGAAGATQDMLVAQDATALLPVGSDIVKVTLSSVCISTRNVPPPQPMEVKDGSLNLPDGRKSIFDPKDPLYVLGPDCPGREGLDAKTWQALVNIKEAGRRLEKEDRFKDVPVADTKSRGFHVIQEAIWKFVGLRSKDPSDQVTLQNNIVSQTDKISKRVLYQPGEIRDDLTPKQKQALNSLIKEGTRIVDGHMQFTDKQLEGLKAIHKSPQEAEAEYLYAGGEIRDPKVLEALSKGGAKVSRKYKGKLEYTKDQLGILVENQKKLLAAVDITVEYSESPGLKGITTLPVTAWDSYYDVGLRAYNNGDFVEADELLKASVSEARTFGEADEKLSRSLVSRGELLMDIPGFLETAEPILNEALKLRKLVQGEKSIEVAQVTDDLGVLKQRQEQFPQSETFLQSAFDIASPTNLAKYSKSLVVKILTDQGRSYLLAQQPEQAAKSLTEAMALAYDENNKTPELADAEACLAKAYLQVGDVERASTLFDRAYSIAADTLAKTCPDHPFMATLLDIKAQLSEKQNRQVQAKEAKDIASGIREKIRQACNNVDLSLLPVGYDALERLRLYAEGKKDLNQNKANLEQTLLKGAEAHWKLRKPNNKPIRDKWAVVIGISNFKDSSINLKYSAKDAQDFADFLVNEENFARDHVHVLLNEKATTTNIRTEIGGKFLPEVAGQDDLVVIYLSSHGSPSQVDVRGANFLVTYDTDKNNLYATGYGMDKLTGDIRDRVRCDRVLVLLDACHSGATALSGAKGLFRVNNFSADDVAQGTGQMVVCSSQPEESSWESKRYPNGVFTHHLMDVLKEQKAGSKLSPLLEQLRNDVDEEVRRDRNGQTQRPVVKTNWEGSDLIIGVKPADPQKGIPQDLILSGLPDAGSKSVGTTAKPQPAIKSKATTQPTVKPPSPAGKPTPASTRTKGPGTPAKHKP